MHENIFIIKCQCLIQVKISDTTCLYVGAIDLRCIDFVSFEDYGGIVARECRIIIY
jgi:hypothetical protein